MAFVLLPCDLPTWPTVIRALNLLKNANSASSFTKTFYELHEYCNVGINYASFEENPLDLFADLEKFLSQESDELQLFSLTLPGMVDLALNIKELRPPRGLQFFLQQEGRDISLPRKFVASLLAHIFFSTMPRRTRNSHPTLTNPCLGPLLSSLERESQRVKLKAFLNYFRLIFTHGAEEGFVTYTRKIKDDSSLSSLGSWCLSVKKLSSFVIKTKGQISEGIHEDAILNCFASSDITRSTLTGKEDSQQVETMVSFPEILVASILSEHLEDNEVFQVSGTLRVADVRNLKTEPSCVLLDSYEVPAVLHNMADAQDYHEDPSVQYKMANFLRELKKAFLGFSSVNYHLVDDGHSSSSDIISISRQQSDEDSGVRRDKNFSSGENNETLDVKHQRMKSLCQRGFNQQAKQFKYKRTTNEFVESEDCERLQVLHREDSYNSSFSNLEQTSNSCKNTNSEEKRGNFADGRRKNSSLSSEGIKCYNRNLHRKRKKKRRNKNSFERLSREIPDETGKNTIREDQRCQKPPDNDGSLEKDHIKEKNLDAINKGSPLFSNRRHMKFIDSYDSRTKDSNYLTADVNDHTTRETKLTPRDKGAQVLIDRVTRAIQVIEAEKEDSQKNINQEVDLSRISISETNTLQSKETGGVNEDENKAKFEKLDKKVTQKPPLPKIPKPKGLPIPAARKAQTSDGKVISDHQPSAHELGCPVADDDTYFSAFESLELHDGSKTNFGKKRPSKRAKEKEARRKSSFAQRLRETLTRGQSTDSTAKEDEPRMETQNEKSDESRSTTAAISKSNTRITVIRKISGDLSCFEDEETVEPFSNRFHRAEERGPETTEEKGLLASFETASENSETTSSVEDDSDDSEDSVSSRYSFSSDYSSDLNEIYEHVEEILQPLNDNGVGPRELAVRRFSNSILKRALSDSYKEVIFSLNGLSCFRDEPPRASRSLSLVLSKETLQESVFEDPIKSLVPKQEKGGFQKRDTWHNIVTGNWGCGKLKGDPQIKVMLQWAAASQANGSTFYFYTFGKEELAQLDEVVGKIESLGWTVGDLVQSIIDFSHARFPNGITRDSRMLENNDKRSAHHENTLNLFDFYLKSKFSKI